MGQLKSFTLGLFTAYGIYYITRKGKDGRSILDELLDNPSAIMNTAKDIAIQDTVHALAKELK